jgi:hypothetical protein
MGGTGCYEACECMANSENTFLLVLQVTSHVVHMVTICMLAAVQAQHKRSTTASQRRELYHNMLQYRC